MKLVFCTICSKQKRDNYIFQQKNRISDEQEFPSSMAIERQCCKRFLQQLTPYFVSINIHTHVAVKSLNQHLVNQKKRNKVLLNWFVKWRKKRKQTRFDWRNLYRVHNFSHTTFHLTSSSLSQRFFSRVCFPMNCDVSSGSHLAFVNRLNV